MQHTVKSQIDSIVKSVKYKSGQVIESGNIIVEL